MPIRWHTLIQAWDRRIASSTSRSAGPTRSGTTPTSSRALDGGRTLMRDTVRYAIGFGPLGALARRSSSHRDLAAIFDHRARLVPALLS